MSRFYWRASAPACAFLAESAGSNRRAPARDERYAESMETLTDLPLALPGLRALRGTTTSRHTGVKDHYGAGRIEQGETEWWGSGAVWRSAPGCILLKQPGDVVRHLSHRGPTTFVAVQLPAHEVASARPEGARVIPQLLAGDERAVPFHRLLDAVVAQTDRLALEVALAEALSALVASAGAGPDYTRPVRRALEYLRVAFAEPTTLETLASHAELDKFHLCRAFRAQVGMPPHAYLTHHRIARAKQLLEGGARASELAPLVGLYDQAQLTRHFRRLVGTTPARYARSPREPEHRGVLFR
jgi:AraC-like DNA-binding protein